MDILERLRNLVKAIDPTQPPKKRDMMMHLVWENVWNHFMAMNDANIEVDEYGYAEYNPDEMHWFQELYVGSGGALFALSVQAGKLYRSAVAVTDTGVTVGQPEQVVMRLEPLARTRVIARTDSNLPIFLSILATSTLNKANEIDTRALFDSFVERFTGETEYINIYHFDKEKSRIGKLQWIGRDENLLLGIWTPDDNIVGRAVAETIEADTEGDWGVSIEFMPDDEGKLVELIPGIEIRAFEAGELWGASVVRSAHACSWFTGHMTGAIERTMKMNKAVKAAIETLIKNPDALTEFETWVDGANRTITDSGAITRTDESATGEQPDLAAQVAALTTAVATLTQKVDAIGTPEQTEAPTIELDEEAAKGIAQAVFAGEGFRTLNDTVARISGAIEGNHKANTDALKALTDRVAKLEKDTGDRLAKVEQGEEEKLRDHDELKPRGSTVTVSWRAPRGKDEGQPTDQKTRSFADMASQTEAGWNR